MKRKNNWYVCFLLTFFVSQASAQTEEEKYIQVITERSDKIVATLGVMDSVKYYQVRDIMVGQYSTLNSHHEQREADIKKLKEEFADQEKALDENRTQYETEKNKELRIIHNVFVDKLEKLLDASQIEGVKNGMTYGVLPLTYGAFQDMIPSLTNEQKAKILNHLIEARDLAMDEPGSREKHGVFGKYKGRINNYLSAEGYDLQKEGEKWKERREQEKISTKD